MPTRANSQLEKQLIQNRMPVDGTARTSDMRRQMQGRQKCPSSQSALGHGTTRFEFPGDGLARFDSLTASRIPVAAATDCFPKLFRLRLGKPWVFVPLRFWVGRVIRGACQWTPPEQIRELSGHSNLRYGSCAVLVVYVDPRAMLAVSSCESGNGLLQPGRPASRITISPSASA